MEYFWLNKCLCPKETIRTWLCPTDTIWLEEHLVGWTKISLLKTGHNTLRSAFLLSLDLWLSPQGSLSKSPYSHNIRLTNSNTLTEETSKPEVAQETLKNSKCVITSQRNQPITGGHPQKRVTQRPHQQPISSRDSLKQAGKGNETGDHLSPSLTNLHIFCWNWRIDL